MKNFYIFVCILLLLAATRFIPHPPNFTSLIALSFYAPALFGLRFIPAVVLSFILTDLFFGFHATTLFTWGSVILIGLVSKFLNNTTFKRVFGSLIGAFIFYIISNFGVWLTGSHGLDSLGIFPTYTLAIPFFMNTLLSTILFSLIIEAVYSQSKIILNKYQL